MTDRKLFYQDPSLDHITTRIVGSGERDGLPWVRLEETIFYPEGGGQPADRGTIGGVPVVDVVSRDEEVLHILDGAPPEGRVECVLDSKRRTDHRHQHTAQHLLTALLYTRHGLWTTAFHLGESYSAIEVRGPAPGPDVLRETEDLANDAIRRAVPVTSRWVDPSEVEKGEVRSRGLPEGHTGKVRLIEIEGYDLNTCGGTHVDNLSEIGVVWIEGAAPARGGTRIRFLAGDRVRRRLHDAAATEAGLRDRLGTGPDGFTEIVDKWVDERKTLAKRVGVLQADLAGRIAVEMAEEAGTRLARRIEGADAGFLSATANLVLAARPEAVVHLVGDGCFLVQSGPAGPEDVSAEGARLRDALGAKGGGRGRMFRGAGGEWREGVLGT